MGIATSATDSPSTMAANIKKLGGFTSKSLGGSTSITVTSYKEYKNFTVDNFFVCVNSVYFIAREYGEVTGTSRTDTVCTKSYNASTGILTISNNSVNYKGSGGRTDHCGITVNYTVYLVY